MNKNRALDIEGTEISLGDKVYWIGRRGLKKGTVEEIRHIRQSGRWNTRMWTWEDGDFQVTKLRVQADDKDYNQGYPRTMLPENVVKVSG